jgi:rhamnosyltransferase
MKLAAVIILYYPNDNVLDNIKSFYNLVDKLIIIDNSEIPNKSIIDKLFELSKAEVHCMLDNIGISRALNMAVDIALNEGYEWLLTMDQDSMFEEGQFKKYLTSFGELMEDKLLGVVGVDYGASGYNNEKDIIEDVPLVITSGSIVSLQICSLLKGFDENLFIDEVDSEYCYRLRKNNYRVCLIQNIKFRHELGKMILVRNWWIGSKVLRNIHAASRIYYMTRNFMYVYAKYHKYFRNELNRNLVVVCNRIKNAFLYSKGSRLKVIFYVIKGIKDFLIGKFGKRI